MSEQTQWRESIDLRICPWTGGVLSLRHQAGRPSEELMETHPSSPQCWGRRFSLLNPHPLFLWDTGAPPHNLPLPPAPRSHWAHWAPQPEEEKAGRGTGQAVKRVVCRIPPLPALGHPGFRNMGCPVRLLVFISLAHCCLTSDKDPLTCLRASPWPHACLHLFCLPLYRSLAWNAYPTPAVRPSAEPCCTLSPQIPASTPLDCDRPSPHPHLEIPFVPNTHF